MFDLDHTTVLSDTTLSLVEELRSVRESIKGLKTREGKIREILLAELKDTEQGLTASGVPVITIDRQVRSRLNGDRLQALYKDAWDDCQVETTVETIRLPESL